MELLLDGRDHLTSADVAKACRRFCSLRTKTSDSRCSFDPFVQIEEFQAVLYLRDRRASHQLHRQLAALQDTHEAVRADVRVLLTAMVQLTLGSPEQQLNMVVSSLDLGESGMKRDHLMILLKATALISQKPGEILPQARDFELRLQRLQDLLGEVDEAGGIPHTTLLEVARHHRDLVMLGTRQLPLSKQEKPTKASDFEARCQALHHQTAAAGG